MIAGQITEANADTQIRQLYECERLTRVIPR